jgi:hypothetical protein
MTTIIIIEILTVIMITIIVIIRRIVFILLRNIDTCVHGLDAISGLRRILSLEIT